MTENRQGLNDNYEARRQKIMDYVQGVESKAIRNTLGESVLITTLVMETWMELCHWIFQGRDVIVKIDSQESHLIAGLARNQEQFDEAINNVASDEEKEVLNAQHKLIQRMGETALRQHKGYTYVVLELLSTLITIAEKTGNSLLQTNNHDESVDAAVQFAKFGFGLVPVFGTIASGAEAIWAIYDDNADKRTADNELLYWESYNRRCMDWCVIAQHMLSGFNAWFQKTVNFAEPFYREPDTREPVEILEERLRGIAAKIEASSPAQG